MWRFTSSFESEIFRFPFFYLLLAPGTLFFFLTLTLLFFFQGNGKLRKTGVDCPKTTRAGKIRGDEARNEDGERDFRLDLVSTCQHMFSLPAIHAVLVSCFSCSVDVRYKSGLSAQKLIQCVMYNSNLLIFWIVSRIDACTNVWFKTYVCFKKYLSLCACICVRQTDTMLLLCDTFIITSTDIMPNLHA